MFLYKGV